MPYAIYSKRTGIISRIVDDATSLLPSESMIEVDEEINYPKEQAATIEGHEVDSFGFPLFLQGVSATYGSKLSYVDYDADNRPFTVKNSPRYVQRTIPGGDPVNRFVDIPIVSNPFAWTADELVAVKYESILAQNHPYDVLIGEEFRNDDHIDIGASTDFVLTEGVCILAPGGVLVTDLFEFKIAKNRESDNKSDAHDYMFDTYYLDIEPDVGESISIYWRGERYSNSSLTGWEPVLPNKAMPTQEVDGTTNTDSTHLRSIQLKIINLSGYIFQIENYMLLLQLRKSIIQN